MDAGNIIALVSFVLIVLAIFVGIPLCVHFEVKAEDKARALRKEEHEAWLAEEMKKDKHAVMFITDGITKTTGNFDPYVYSPGAKRFPGKTTSEDAAKQQLARFYEKGYMVDELSITYPVCNVQSAFTMNTAKAPANE